MIHSLDATQKPPSLTCSLTLKKYYIFNSLENYSPKRTFSQYYQLGDEIDMERTFLCEYPPPL